MVFANLVEKEAKPEEYTFQIVVIFNPRYAKPPIVGTNRALSADDAWRLFADRWAAKQMLGCHW